MSYPVAELEHRTQRLGALWLALLVLAVAVTLLQGDAVGVQLMHDPAWVGAYRRPIELLSRYGMWPFYGLFLATLALGWYTRDRRWVYLALGYLLAQLLGPVVLVRILKMLVGRARPDVAGQLGADESGLSWSAALHSFPSGHTADLVTSMFFIALLVRRTWAAGVGLAWAVAVAWSRVALAKHFPSDVIGGAAIGVVTTLAVVQLWLAPRWERASGSGPSGPHGRGPFDIIPRAAAEHRAPNLASHHSPA